MKKGIILALVLCVLATGIVYAGKLSISAQITPYSLQIVSAGDGSHFSTYGYGAKGGFRVNVWDNLSVGLDADFNLYKYDELTSDYIVIALRAAAGYSYDFTDRFYAQAGLGVGFDSRKVGSYGKTYFGADLCLGCGYRLSDQVAATAGADVGLGLQKGKFTKSLDISVKTRFGLLMAL